MFTNEDFHITTKVEDVELHQNAFSMNTRYTFFVSSKIIEMSVSPQIASMVCNYLDTRSFHDICQELGYVKSNDKDRFCRCPFCDNDNIHTQLSIDSLDNASHTYHQMDHVLIKETVYIAKNFCPKCSMLLNARSSKFPFDSISAIYMEYFKNDFMAATEGNLLLYGTKYTPARTIHLSNEAYNEANRLFDYFGELNPSGIHLERFYSKLVKHLESQLPRSIFTNFPSL